MGAQHCSNSFSQLCIPTTRRYWIQALKVAMLLLERQFRNTRGLMAQAWLAGQGLHGSDADSCRISFCALTVSCMLHLLYSCYYLPSPSPPHQGKGKGDSYPTPLRPCLTIQCLLESLRPKGGREP